MWRTNKQQLRPHLCQRQRHLCGLFPDEAVGRRRNQDDIAQADVGRDSPPSQPGHRRGLSRRPHRRDRAVRDHRIRPGPASTFFRLSFKIESRQLVYLASARG
jgi:hypothetical protein